MESPDRSPLPEWQTLYDEAACGLLLTERDGSICLANTTFCRWLGVDAASLIGRRRFQDLLTVGGKIFHQTHWAPLLQMQGSVAEVKIDLVHSSGRMIPMLLNAVSRERGGTTRHELSLVVAEDRHAYERELLRARKRAEELLQQQLAAQNALALADARLRLALEAAHLHAWEIDADTRAHRYGDSVALLLGLPVPQAISAARFLDAIEAADRDSVNAVVERISGERAVYGFTFRLNGVDGAQRTILATAQPVTESGKDAPLAVGLLQDITELSRQRAAAEDRALFAEQMIGIVSHDLRNPLSTITLGSKLMAKSDLAAEQRQRILASIDRSAAHAHRLTTDLLDFTMARVGKGVSVDPQRVDVRAVVSALVEELSLAHSTEHVIYHHSGEPFAFVDPGRLGQLVGNLVSNAVAYGDKVLPITVKSEVAADVLVVAVRNFGEPIAQALLPNLFQPMVRGAVGAAGDRSVGLGLYIVNEIARAHGGHVAVSSSIEDGTKFTCSFPQPNGRATVSADSDPR